MLFFYLLYLIAKWEHLSMHISSRLCFKKNHLHYILVWLEIKSDFWNTLVHDYNCQPTPNWHNLSLLQHHTMTIRAEKIKMEHATHWNLIIWERSNMSKCQPVKSYALLKVLQIFTYLVSSRMCVRHCV